MKVRYLYDKTIVLAFKQVARVVAFLYPRDKGLVAIGSWEGDRICESPKYLLDYLLEKTDLRVAWIGKACVKEALPKHPRLKFVRKDSIQAFLSLLRAGTWVFCISIEWDLTAWPIEGRAKLINTWHSYGIKRFTNGAAPQKKASLAGRIVRFFEWHRRPWATVGGESDVSNLVECSPRDFRSDRILRVGTPSNDYLIKMSQNLEYLGSVRARYKRVLGIPEDKKVITYLPTWRNPNNDFFAFFKLDEHVSLKWRQMLEMNNAVIIEKHHPRTIATSVNQVKGDACSVVVYPKQQQEVDVQDLMLVTDILISDYSGCIQDFGVLNRPAIHFMYDFDDYMVSNSGLVDGWREKLAGPLVMNEEELFTQVSEFLINPKAKPAPGFAETCKYQTGHACEQLLEFIRK